MNKIKVHDPPINPGFKTRKQVDGRIYYIHDIFIVLSAKIKHGCREGDEKNQKHVKNHHILKKSTDEPGTQNKTLGELAGSYLNHVSCNMKNTNLPI